MLIPYLVAAFVATVAAYALTGARASEKYPDLAYWRRWDSAGVVMNFAPLYAIDALAGVTVAAVAAQLHYRLVDHGAGRDWANGATYGAIAFLILRIEIPGIDLTVFVPFRLLFGLFERRINAVMPGCAERGVMRQVGDLLPRQLCRASTQLFRLHEIAILDEATAFDNWGSPGMIVGEVTRALVRVGV